MYAVAGRKGGVREEEGRERGREGKGREGGKGKGGRRFEEKN